MLLSVRGYTGTVEYASPRLAQYSGRIQLPSIDETEQSSTLISGLADSVSESPR